MNIYVKTVSVDAANAMKALEMMCATTVQPERLGSSRVSRRCSYEKSASLDARCS